MCTRLCQVVRVRPGPGFQVQMTSDVPVGSIPTDSDAWHRDPRGPARPWVWLWTLQVKVPSQLEVGLRTLAAWLKLG